MKASAVNRKFKKLLKSVENQSRPSCNDLKKIAVITYDFENDSTTINHVMSKDEAIEALKRGEKIVHENFSEGEWIMYNDGYFIFEDGVMCSPYEFWRWRTDKSWNTGYFIYDKY